MGFLLITGFALVLLLLPSSSQAFVLVPTTSTPTTTSKSWRRSKQQQQDDLRRRRQLLPFPFPSSSSSSSLSRRPATVQRHMLMSGISSTTTILNPKAILCVCWTTFKNFVSVIMKELIALNTKQRLLFVSAIFIGFILGRIEPFWKRYTDVMDIPSSLFGPNSKPLVGRAITVSDGDTIRFLHQPTRFHPASLRKDKGEKASDVALPVRVCTIDTPETPKFGKPGQKYGKEAKEALRSLLDNKRVKVRLLQKDQYGRIVGQVYTTPLLPFSKPIQVDEYMLSNGLAEVYRGGGAVYGPAGFQKYESLEEQARRNKTGMWSLGTKRESASDYKKRTK